MPIDHCITARREFDTEPIVTELTCTHDGDCDYAVAFEQDGWDPFGWHPEVNDGRPFGTFPLAVRIDEADEGAWHDAGIRFWLYAQ